MSMSATGDLAELQREFSERLASGVDGFPIRRRAMSSTRPSSASRTSTTCSAPTSTTTCWAITGWRQHWWVEKGNQLFRTRSSFCKPDERTNYQRVIKANRLKRGRIWTAEDYQEFHTVAAFRSARLPHLPKPQPQKLQPQKPGRGS